MPRAEWVIRFSARLGELRPEVVGDLAYCLAVADLGHEEAGEQSPEHVAEVYVLEGPIAGFKHWPRHAGGLVCEPSFVGASQDGKPSGGIQGLASAVALNASAPSRLS
jgi:hypothetical protein